MSYDFESSESDYLVVGNDAGADGGSDCSMACWFKPESLSADQTLMTLNLAASASSSANNLALGVNSSGQLYAEWETSKVTLSSPTLSADTWYFCAMAMDTGNIIVQLNDTDTSGSESRSGNWDQLVIGSNGYAAGFGEFVDGKIAEAAVYSAPLTTTEMDNLYNSGSGVDMDSEGTCTWYRKLRADLTTPATGTDPTNNGAVLDSGDNPWAESGGGSSVAPLAFNHLMKMKRT